MEFISSIDGNKLKSSLELINSQVPELQKHLGCNLYEHALDFLYLPRESIDLQTARDLATKNSGLKYVFVVGIGGATSASKAVISALLHEEKKAKVSFFDTLDQNLLEDLKLIASDLTEKKEFILIVISKSGSALETNLNAKDVAGILEEKFGNITDRTIVLTLGDSPLWRNTLEGATKIPLRTNISDRYSTFSIIGLLPLALAGIDVENFLAGARDILKKFENNETDIIHSAAVSDYLYRLGKTIRNFFFFSPELEWLGKWTKQLVAESLGKNNKGVMPVVSMGPEDLHSIAQLILDGPDNVFTTFIKIEKDKNENVNNSKTFGLLEPGLAGKEISEVKNKIYSGFLESMGAHSRPYMQIILSDLSAFSLGQYMQFMMIETTLLGLVWGIDPFNQPAVEEYKSNALAALRMMNDE